MKIIHRSLTPAGLIALAAILSACESGGFV